jgi:hypothetical protein
LCARTRKLYCFQLYFLIPPNELLTCSTYYKLWIFGLVFTVHHAN